MQAHASSARSGRVRLLPTRFLLSLFAVVLMYGGLQTRAEAQALYSFDLDWESTPASVNVAAVRVSESAPLRKPSFGSDEKIFR